MSIKKLFFLLFFCSLPLPVFLMSQIVEPYYAVFDYMNLVSTFDFRFPDQKTAVNFMTYLVNRIRALESYLSNESNTYYFPSVQRGYVRLYSIHVEMTILRLLVIKEEELKQSEKLSYFTRNTIVHDEIAELSSKKMRRRRFYREELALNEACLKYLQNYFQSYAFITRK